MYEIQYKGRKVKRNVRIQYKGKKECTNYSIKVKRNVRIPV